MTTDAQNHGQTVWIPMQAKEPSVSVPIKLEATLYKPDGEGRFPLVIYNHGSTGPGDVPADHTDNPWGLGQYLLRKNIALLVPMRRGRGKSEGRYLESYECSLRTSREGIRYASESLDAVYAYLSTQPWVDMRKIVLTGTSRGGMLSVVYAAEHPGSAVGAVNFVGGWMGDGCVAKIQVDVNAVLFAEAGKKATVPNLFLYATRDPYYTSTRLADYADAFRNAGGVVDFKLYEMDASSNGHALFWVHWRMWMDEFDAFLVRTGMWKP